MNKNNETLNVSTSKKRKTSSFMTASSKPIHKDDEYKLSMEKEYLMTEPLITPVK